MDPKLIIYDTETTGLDPKAGHRIIEFGAVEIVDKKPTDNKLHLYFNPGRDIDEDAFKKHGLSRDFLSQYPTFEAQLGQIAEFIKGGIMVAHNAKFDESFMDMEMRKVNPEKGFKDYIAGVQDSLLIARRVYPNVRNTVDALADRLKIDRSQRTKHGALIDSELLAEIYIKMTEGLNLTEVMRSREDYEPPRPISYIDRSQVELNLVVVEPDLETASGFSP